MVPMGPFPSSHDTSAEAGPWLSEAHDGVPVCELRRTGVLASAMARRERNILERAVHAVSEQAKNASSIVDEASPPGSTAHIP